MDKLLKEAQLYDMHNKCSESYEEESLTVALLSGLFIVVFSLIIIALLGSLIVRKLGLPFSTLSDEALRRTREKDAERDYIELHRKKQKSSGRSARMKGHNMTGHLAHDRETPAERKARERKEMLTKMGVSTEYNAKFERPKANFEHAPTKHVLKQVRPTVVIIRL